MTETIAEPGAPEEILPHGTRIALRDGLPVQAVDRRGTSVFTAVWTGGRLQSARFRIPDGREVEVRNSDAQHPLFGNVCELAMEDGPALTACQVVDWAHPACIPPMDRPGSLPSGAGGAVLNFLALQAARAQHATVRYRGPYPTGALFDALTESFTVPGDLHEAFARFTAGVEDAAAAGTDVEPEVDFAPAPFERVWGPNDVCVQLRAGVEKVYICGRAYARDAAGARRVRKTDDGWRAVIEIAGDVWADRLHLTEAGDVVGEPLPLPPVDNRYVGKRVPETVRALLATFLPGRAPALLRAPLEEVLATLPMVWGDSGDELAVVREETFVLHAALPERLAHEKTETAVHVIVEAVEPVAQRLAQSRLAALVDAAVEQLGD